MSGGLESNIYRPEDRENFTLLLAELRSQLDAAGDYLLTIAAPASPMIIENIEVEEIHLYLDWINIMTYDFHGPWGGDADVVTNFLAALYPAGEDPLDEPYHSQFNMSATVQTYLDFGVPAEKINPGLPFYGRGFANVEDVNNGLFANWSGLPLGTWENGVRDYWDIAQNFVNVNGYTEFWHSESIVPWVFNPATQIMYSYENPSSIAAKCQYINNQNLGGVMFWEFSTDKYGELLDIVYNELDIETPVCFLVGDVNDDGELNILDIVSIVGFILGDIQELDVEICADCNLDGNIDVLDVVCIVNILIDSNE